MPQGSIYLQFYNEEDAKRALNSLKDVEIAASLKAPYKDRSRTYVEMRFGDERMAAEAVKELARLGFTFMVTHE